MIATLSEILLRLAASAGGDGGAAVSRTLEGVLSEAAPFDVAEMALRNERGVTRIGLGEGGHFFIGDDLLHHVLGLGEAFRIDHLEEARAFPSTCERLAAQGLSSALVLPARFEGGPEGVLALARRHGWAFVGASLPILSPVARMALLAVDRSLTLTALGHGPAGVAASAAAEAMALRWARQHEELSRALEDRLADAECSTQALFASAERHRVSAEKAEDAVLRLAQEGDLARQQAEVARKEEAAVASREALDSLERRVAAERELEQRLAVVESARHAWASEAASARERALGLEAELRSVRAAMEAREAAAAVVEGAHDQLARELAAVRDALGRAVLERDQARARLDEALVAGAAALVPGPDPGEGDGLPAEPRHKSGRRRGRRP
jgi:hypothetical protein